VLFMNTKPHEHVEMKFPEYVFDRPNSGGAWRSVEMSSAIGSERY
jgi:hypothetical protein